MRSENEINAMRDKITAEFEKSPDDDQIEALHDLIWWVSDTAMSDDHVTQYFELFS